MSKSKLRKRHRWTCQYKQRFTTEALANERLRTIKTRPIRQLKGDRDSLNVYLCLNGEDHFHMGHDPKLRRGRC